MIMINSRANAKTHKTNTIPRAIKHNINKKTIKNAAPHCGKLGYTPKFVKIAVKFAHHPANIPVGNYDTNNYKSSSLKVNLPSILVVTLFIK